MIVYRDKVRRKYLNVPITIDGNRFDSTKEGERYKELVLKQKAGLITDLVIHPRFDLIVNMTKIGFYKTDFSYTENGIFIVEDVKGWKRTEAYRIKKKLMKALYNIEIIET